MQTPITKFLQGVLVKSDTILNFSQTKYLIMFTRIETACSIVDKAEDEI
jgi:hypothetical protein